MSITFDIETIPQQTPLTEYQQEQLDKRLKYELKEYVNGDKPTDEILKDIRRKTMALCPYLGTVICICTFNDFTNEKTKIINGTEQDILTTFWETIESESEFISFNGLSFDVPWIIIKSAIYQIPIRKGHPFTNRRRYYTKPHFDLAEWSSDWRPQFRVSLKGLCEMLGIDSPKEGVVRADSVEKFYLEGKIKEIAEYCMRDVLATHQGYKKWIGYVNN